MKAGSVSDALSETNIDVFKQHTTLSIYDISGAKNHLGMLDEHDKSLYISSRQVRRVIYKLFSCSPISQVGLLCG